MSTRFTLTPSTPLPITFDPEARIASVPRDATIKGIFLAKYVGPLGRQFAEVARTLDAPPTVGRYLPFSDYPLRDMLRLLYATAARTHPGTPLPDACRRITRADLEVFGASSAGKVALALMTDPQAMLLRLPQLTRSMFSDYRGTSELLPGGGVRVHASGMHAQADCGAIGVLEGIVMFFGKTPRIEVDARSPSDATYDVTWA